MGLKQSDWDPQDDQYGARMENCLLNKDPNDINRGNTVPKSNRQNRIRRMSKKIFSFKKFRAEYNRYG